MKKFILFMMIALPSCAFCAPNENPFTFLDNDTARHALTQRYSDNFTLFQDFHVKDAATGVILTNPWVLPNDINVGGRVAPCAALLKENREVLKNIYSDGDLSHICENADAAFNRRAEEIQKLVKGLGKQGISYAFFNGDNATMPRGCYYDSMIKALLGAGAVNVASGENIMDLANVKEEDKDNLLMIVPTALVQEDFQDFGFHAAVFEGNIPTPEGIEDFAASVAGALKEMVQTARDKNGKKEADEKTKKLKEALNAAPPAYSKGNESLKVKI